MLVPWHRQSYCCNRLARFQSSLVRRYGYGIGNGNGYRSISNGASSGLWLKDTASILSPRWRHLSVCFGAVLPLVTPLKSNLFRYGNNIRSGNRNNHKKNPIHDRGAHTAHMHMLEEIVAPGRLAQDLYFQPHAGAPLQPTKSKSMAAAHIDPAIWGTLLGLALHHNNHDVATGGSLGNATHNTTQQEFTSILRTRHGIKSNHVRDEWTGVSLARWEELYHAWRRRPPTTTATTSANDNDSLSFTSLCSQSLWSMMLWDISTCKRDILDAFLSLHEACPSLHQHNTIMPLLDHDHNNPLVQALLHDESARMEWASSLFLTPPSKLKQHTEDEDEVSQAMEQLLKGSRSQMEWDSLRTAQSIEVLCAHCMFNHNGSRQAKSPTPNGYYGYDGGPTKPDCVEVTVRELMDLLLWDEQEGSFNLNRLPQTAHPVLFELYRRPSIDKLSLAAAADQTIQGRGQEWFDALSNLSSCDYLTQSPNGKGYELTPTMRNLSRVFQRLLLHHQPKTSGTTAATSSLSSNRRDWTTLNDLRDFWNGRAVADHSPLLHVALGQLSHRAAMSDDIIVHEVATVWLEGSNMSMDFRLRNDPTRNTGFATVTHLRRRRSSQPMRSPELYQELHLAKRQGIIKSHCLDLMLLLLAQGEEYDHGMERDTHKGSSCSTTSMDDLYCEFLGCRTYGLDRRKLMELTATADLEREALAVRNEQRQGDRILKEAIRHVGNFLKKADQDHQAGLPLLSWLLSECPDVYNYSDEIVRPKRFHDKAFENALLSIPFLLEKRVDETNHDRLRQGILENSFIRGSLLVAWVDWKMGRTSLIESLRRLRPTEVMVFLAMMARGSPS